MLKNLKKSMLVAMSMMTVFQGLNPLSWFTGNFWPETEAAYYQDDNAGKYELTFTDPQGIIHREWVSLSGGVLSLEQGEKEGKIITSQVEPVSMRGWEVLKIDWTKPTGNEIRVNLLDCDSWEVIQWWNNIEYKEGGLPLTGSNLKWYKCLQTEVTLSREDEEYSSQMITKIELEYTVLPVLTSNIEPAKGTVEACSNLSYNVAYSNNYVTEMETVVYVELPSSEAWTITGYDEDIAKYPELNPTFVSATGWGKYTQTGLVLYNREIPANSVYWDIGVMDAGDTRLHSFTLNVPCGTMNGTKYQVSSSMNGKLSDLFISEQKEVIITASPYPTITKGASGLLYYKSKGYLFLGYNDSLNYSVYVSNGGTESMYVSKVVDDLSDVANKLETTCGGVSLQERVTHISDGGILEWTKITWELWTLKSRTNKTLTYDVNFSGCNVDGTTFKNTATLSSKNTEDKTAINIVELINNLKPDGNYSKSAWSTYYYGDVVSYTLRFRNTGPLRMEDFVFEDVLPDDVEYVSADIVSEHEWTVTVDGKKVTVNIEGCIDSPYFPSPSGSSCYRGPKEVIVVIKAQIKNKAICTPTTIRNSANFYANKTSVSYINDDNSMTGSPLQGTDSWSLVAKPLVGELRMGINGPRTLKPKEKGTYTINVSNIGKDTSKTTKLTIQIPKITVNGTEQYASISNIAWGIVDYTKVSQWIIQVDLEEILAWRSKQVSFELWPIPSGVFQGTKIDIAANVVGNDDVCGSFQSTTSMSNTFESEKRLYIRKTSRESYMLSAWEVEYQIIIQNMGTSPTTNTYIVDIVPNKATFVEAYTTATTKEKKYSCEGCKVFFAKENINLPEKREPYKPFNAGLISKYFEVGTEENGVWKSPYGENTKYVAYLVDDTATSLFPSGWEKMVGIKLKNNGTRIGALLTNVAWAFSRDLLQTIGNPKALTVLEYPGLKTEMNSTKEIISACESFDWEIPYVHDGNVENEITTLTVRLPNTVDLEEISHVWSSRSQTEGNLTGNVVGIKENSNVQITTINEETVISVNINGYLGYNLQPGWGGTLKVKVKAKCDTISDTIIIGTVVGHFKNAISYGDVSSEDDVQIKNADLYLRKNVDRRDPVYGETISYTLTIANKGERHASDVVIQDYLPEWVCYKSWSALVIQPGNRSVGEPFVEGDCGGSGQILTWSKSTNNALTQTEKTPGEIPGSSEDIYIRYSGIVDGDIPLGVSLINGAKVITADPQDNNYEKEDQQEIQVPYPSLYVEMESPRIVEWGWVFDYEIKYGNQSRMCANKTQLVLALPNQELGSSGITKLRAVVPNNGEEIYSLSCPYTSELPTFDRENPTEWGWTKGVVHNACYIAVKVPEKEFCSAQGQRKLVMSVQATNPLTNIKLPAGAQMTGEVIINNARGEYDLNDNYSSSTTKIPAMDLWIEITGNPEGIFPGVLPNDVIDYTVTYGNYGNELSCANKIKVDISENTKIESYDFVKLKIKDQRWVDMKLREPTDEEIKEDVNVSMKTEKNSYIFDLWGEGVCFPGNSEGSFILSVRTSNGLNDSTPIIAEAEIWEESPAIEDTMDNNISKSSTMVYLSDVIIEKTAIVDSDGNEIYGNTGDSKDMAKKGDHVKYSLKYDNIWNYAAENVVILETIPVDTCFKVGSIKVPQDADIQYSSDWGLTWDYSPQWNVDCQVTTVRLILKNSLEAPSNKIEGSFYENWAWEVYEDPILSEYLSSTYRPREVKTFSIEGEHYIIYPSYWQKVSIFKRNKSLSKFEPRNRTNFPQINWYRSNVDSFTMNGDNYLVFSKNSEGNNGGGGIEFWKWDNMNSSFKMDNSLLFPTFSQDFMDVVSFEIDETIFIALQAYRGNHKVLKRNWSAFTTVSTPTHSNSYGGDTSYFSYKGEHYLTFTNENNLVSKSFIWKWNWTAFVSFQEIETYRWPGTFIPFEINDNAYLLHSRNSQNTKLRKWNEYSFNLFDSNKYPQILNVSSTYFSSNNKDYIIQWSNFSGGKTVIWERNNDWFSLLSSEGHYPDTQDNKWKATYWSQGKNNYLFFQNLTIWKQSSAWPLSTGFEVKLLSDWNKVLSWDKLFVDYKGDVLFSIYNNHSLEGSPLISEMNPISYIDLSGLSYIGKLYLKAEIIEEWSEVGDYALTYFSDEKSEITLEAVVREDKILWEEIINTARITTTTPEISTENNESSHILYTESTDLAITKTVDKSVAWAGDILRYTITYENKGPKNAKNVLISDRLPEGVDFVSSTPQLSTPGYENGAWHLDYTTDGYASEISFELTDGAGTILAQKTRSTHNSNNTTFTFTGQLTTAGTITMSRRDSYGDGDGNYKLYLDGDLILEWAKRTNTQTTETKTYEGFIPQIKGYDLVIPELPVGSGWTMEILAKITTGASQGSIYTNTVEISSSTAEDRPEDNKAIAITTLGEVANLFTKLELSPRYTPNGEVKIILNYGNNGNKNTEQTNLMLTANPYMILKSSTNTGYTMSWSTLKRELWMQAQQEEKQIELIFQVANDQSLLENDVALEVNALISSITPEVNLLDNKSVATSIPSEGWMVSLEWQVYIDVDKTNNLTENDTKLQSQTVNFLGLTTKWITITGEIQTDVEGKYQIINLDPGTYELQIVPNIGYETVYSKAGYNLDNEIKGKGSLEGWTDKRKIIEIKWYSEERIQGLDFALDNKELTNVYTNIKLAGYTDVVSLDVEYGNTTTIPAAWTTLKISLDPNVIYKGSSNKNLVYQEDKHELLFNIWNLTTKDNHFTINVEIDSSKLTEETIRYHSFNFVSTIETKTLPEITKLDNISTIDQRIVMVGDVSGKVYLDKDGVLGWNEDKDEVLSGYTVELRSMSWTVEKTVTTSSTGYYEFINIKPGLYQLVVPETWHYQSLASFPGIIGATAITTGESLNISTIQLEVNSATTYENFDFSLKLLPSSLGGKISLSNGLPLEYIEVLLQNDNWEQEKSFTNASGDYVFAVEAGTYSLSYILPPAYVAHIASVGNLGGNILSDQEINEIVIDYDQQGINYDFILRAESQQIQGTVYKVDENGGFLKPAGWVVVYLNNQTQQHSLQVIEGFNTLLSIGKENSEKVWIITKEEIITEDKTKAEDLLASGELTESEVILYGEITPESIAELETASTTDQIVDSMEEISSESDKLEPSNKAEVLQSGEENLETKWSDEQTTTLSTQETQETVTQQKIQNLSTTQVLPLSAVDMVITDDQGRYNFTVTEAGNYYITHNVPLPQLSHEAYPGKNPETGISNAHKISEKEIEVEILAGDSSIQNNFAVKSPQTAINVGVYYDANDDGTYEYGIDQLLSWVTVSIYKEGKQIWVGLTLPEGGYVFKEMEAGTYDVVYTLPNWYIAKSQQKTTIQLWNGEIQDVYFPVQKKTLYDLGVQKTVDKTNANPGDTLVYTITVRNLGNIVVGKDILVRDVWPQWLEYISDDGKFSSYKDGEERVFKIPTLDAWATEIITLTAKVPTTATDATVYTNGVKVISGSPKETNLLNNESYVSTTISKKGSSTWWGNGGGPNPLLPDECPDGDYSPSFYDKTCWEKPPKEECEGDSCKEQEHGSPETPKPNEENKVVIIESDDEYLGTKDFKNPWELPKTWPEELIFRRAKVIKSSNVYVAYPDWFKPSTNDDIEYWKQVLPYAMDRYESAYIVLPKMWAIAPIREMEDYSDKSLYLNGEVEKVDVNKYLKRGVLHYPWSAKYGETGNAVIVGHSSYFNKDNGRYKTVFQSIIGLNQGDVIRIYQLNKDGKYDKYEYIVERSYETGSKDVGVLEPGYGRNLTLITCIPIGTVSSRWVVQAKIPAKTIQIVKEVKK